jgi:hypothetical protein
MFPTTSREGGGGGETDRQRQRNKILLPTEIYSKNRGEVALRYNRMKVAAHLGDQMTREHTCIRQTKSCPLTFFMKTVDIAAPTTYNIWMEKKVALHV